MCECFHGIYNAMIFLCVEMQSSRKTSFQLVSRNKIFSKPFSTFYQEMLTVAVKCNVNMLLKKISISYLRLRKMKEKLLIEGEIENVFFMHILYFL